MAVTLTLEIVGPRAAQFATVRKTFDAVGGRIGRASDNDWVISDAYISQEHARIHFRDGQYWLEDTSTNGVFVVSPGHRLANGQLYPLYSGEHFFIDTIEILVTLSGTQPDDELSDESRDFSPRTVSPTEVMGLLDIDIPVPVNLAIDTSDQTERMQNAVSSHTEGFDDVFRVEAEARRNSPPAFVAPAVSVASASTTPVAVAAATGQHAALSIPDDADSMRAVLIGAGLPESQVTPELAETMGRILSVVVTGLMDVLNARGQTKEELRMRGTTFQSTNNNPIKFSANVEDALHNLFVKRNEAYLRPEAAIEDAFIDVRNHQLAMLAAMRMAFDDMLSRFEPGYLGERFDRQLNSSGWLQLPAKFKYWDMYQEVFQDMVKNPQKCFRDLFGDQFNKSYQEQLERLSLAQRQSK